VFAEHVTGIHKAQNLCEKDRVKYHYYLDLLLKMDGHEYYGPLIKETRTTLSNLCR
jgi:hypothetical protein